MIVSPSSTCQFGELAMWTWIAFPSADQVIDPAVSLVRFKGTGRSEVSVCVVCRR